MNPTIHTAFWSDPDIEAVDSPVKLAILWLLTNPQTNIIGLCKVSGKRFQFETGLEPTWLDKACEQLPRAILRTADGIWIRNFIRHQFGVGERLLKNNCIRPIFAALAAIKDASLRSALVETYPELTHPDSKGTQSPLQAPSEGLQRGREENGGEGKGSGQDGGAGETAAPPPTGNPPAQGDEPREVSADNIAAAVQRIFKTTRRPGSEAMHKIAEAMPVMETEIAELERFYAAPADPDNPAMARCTTPTNLCLQLADQLVKAREYCRRKGGARNGSSGGPPVVKPPPSAADFDAWRQTLRPDASGFTWADREWVELPSEKQSQCRHWIEQNRKPTTT